MASPLAGKVAVVTGASRGIGAATAIALCRAGASVFLIARSLKELKAVEALCKAVDITSGLSSLLGAALGARGMLRHRHDG
jgi:NAD(P)-dependent dehydrogenase (short-subunit alcohol dehydrogenase family)